MCFKRKRDELKVSFNQDDEVVEIPKCWICGGGVSLYEKAHEGCIVIYNRIMLKRQEILNLEWQLFLISQHNINDNPVG